MEKDLTKLATEIADVIRRAEHALNQLHRMLATLQTRLEGDGYDCTIDEASITPALGGTDKPPGP